MSKIKLFLCVSSFSFLMGCNNYEIPPTWYNFTVDNELVSDTVYFSYQTTSESYPKKVAIPPRQNFIKKLGQPYCYFDLGDSVFVHFFVNIELEIKKKEISKEIKNIKNWEIQFDLKRNGMPFWWKINHRNCKWGNCNYTFTIKEDDVEKQKKILKI